MHPNEKLIHTFYTCFQQLDADGMAACYHADICFSDPAFPDLKGAEAGAMWKMLCSQAKGFELSFSDISANDTTGSARWKPNMILPQPAGGCTIASTLNLNFRTERLFSIMIPLISGSGASWHWGRWV